jgi:hypothetical protein
MTFASRTVTWNALESSRNVILGSWTQVPSGIVQRCVVDPTPIGTWSIVADADDRRPEVERLFSIVRTLRSKGRHGAAYHHSRGAIAARL